MKQGPPRSAKAFADSVAAEAYANAGKQLPDDSKEPVPLVPIYIGIDRDNFATPQEPLREVSSAQPLCWVCCRLGWKQAQ